MNPSPFEVFWSGLTQGLFIWPFETSPGTYFALPIYFVVPVIATLIVAIGGAYLVSVRREEKPN
jgi:hypothetical protein